MAEIPVEKKSSMTWLWVLLALVLAALLIWWFAAGDDDVDPVVDDTSETELVATETPIAADAMPLTLAAVVAQPQDYIGQEFSGEVGVDGPLTDRGFWIESDGARMFALIIDEPMEVPLDINAGQTLQISGGTIRAGGEVTEVEGAPLDDDTRSVIADQEVFLIVDEARIEILERS
ncbi:hypothetical protein A9995_03005 [Erythrobacter sp. QSSC1-22B]|uniref:hypothetical protein n=1 Tax=Erythrobacter sp. QSSC1-22B TaxID=1860125 RepID=UPI0008048356|nr:hypothetical protein [Erythrobacter sp. QSSC1-22B]OBX20681.1 hypothetical protein A9995_03005 [Erythrobacter sp. QSSC1-22B]